MEGLAPYGIDVQPMQAAPIGAADPWFTACQGASVCIALLCEEFLQSERCEDQVTFAKDTRHKTVAVVVDENGLVSGMELSQDEQSMRQKLLELEAEVSRLSCELAATQRS